MFSEGYQQITCLHLTGINITVGLIQWLNHLVQWAFPFQQLLFIMVSLAMRVWILFKIKKMEMHKDSGLMIILNNFWQHAIILTSLYSIHKNSLIAFPSSSILRKNGSQSFLMEQLDNFMLDSFKFLLIQLWVLDHQMIPR